MLGSRCCVVMCGGVTALSCAGLCGAIIAASAWYGCLIVNIVGAPVGRLFDAYSDDAGKV